MRNLVSLLALASAALAATPAAAATVIDFNELTTPNFYQGYSSVTSKGYLFTNTYTFNGALIVWGTGTSYNADPSGATLSNNYGGTTTTVTKVGGGSFKFNSIDLADVYNNGTGGSVLFSFVGAGSPASQTVALDSLPGLQKFNFNLSGLTSVSYTPLTTQGPWIQVDNLVFDAAGAVPEPATWAMMIGGFGMVGAAMRRKRARTTLAYA